MNKLSYYGLIGILVFGAWHRTASAHLIPPVVMNNTFNAITSIGRIVLDRSSYGHGVAMTVTVEDLDLDLNPDALDTCIVIVASTAGDNEELTLTETGLSTAQFTAAINVLNGNVVPANGILEALHGDTLTATYLDADPLRRDTPRIATAEADFVPVQITLVDFNPIGITTATVQVQTDGVCTGVVRYGEALPLSMEAPLLGSSGSYLADLADLFQCTTYQGEIAVEDAAGNVTIDNNGGQYYSFQTAGSQILLRQAMDGNPEWTISGGEWEWGVPLGQGGDPTSGYSGSSVYGYNLAGEYADNLPEYYLTSTAIDCTGATDVHVSFWRWLGVEEASYDQAAFQVSNDGASWTSIFANDYNSIDDRVWIYQEFDISAVADNQATVYLRWVMGPTDYVVTMCGWNIDDVVVWGSFPCTSPYLINPNNTFDDTIGGNGDGQPNPGESVFMAISLQNIGGVAATSVSAVLTTSAQDIVIADATAEFPDIPHNAIADSLAPHFAWSSSPQTPDRTAIPFRLTWTAVENSGVIDFTVWIGNPDLHYTYHQVGDEAGDDDGIADPDEVVNLAIKLNNVGVTAAVGVAGTLSSTSSDITILDNSASWPDIPAGEAALSLADPCQVGVNPDAAIGTLVEFTLALEAIGYSTQVSFTLAIGTHRILVINDASLGSSGVFTSCLTALDYLVTEETVSSTDPQTWVTYNLLISSSGNNASPVTENWYRDALIAYVQSGGRLLVEGGEVGSNGEYYFPSFVQSVMHESDWIIGSSSGDVVIANATHPLVLYPNILPATIPYPGQNYAEKDCMTVLPDANLVLSWTECEHASVACYDQNSNPYDGGQTVVFNFAINNLDNGGDNREMVIQNAVNWLLSCRPTPYLLHASHDIDDTAGGNGDGMVNPGETIVMPVTLQNIGAIDATSITAVVQTSSPYATILTSEVTFPDIPATEFGGSFPPHIVWQAASSAPDNTTVTFHLAWSSDQGSGALRFTETIGTPCVTYGSQTIEDPLGDNDGIADPGEEITLKIMLYNSGSVGVSDLTGVLSSESPNFTVLDAEGQFPDLLPGQSGMSLPNHFSGQVASNASVGDMMPLTLQITADGYSTLVHFLLPVGTQPVLVIDDLSSGNAEVFVTMLTSLGMVVVEETVSTTNPETWNNYSLLISSSGNNGGPVSSASYRTALENYVAAGGKLLVEGGEVAHDSLSSPGYPSFAANVLHEQQFISGSGRYLIVNSYAHPLTSYPNLLPPRIDHEYPSTYTSDTVVPGEGASAIFTWQDNDGEAAVGWDPDTNPYNGGQILVFNFTIDSVAGGSVVRDHLIGNAVSWLLRQDDSVYLTYSSHEIDDSASGNGDGYINPGETIIMPISLQNVSRLTSEEITAQVHTASDWVTILNPAITFPALPAGAIGASNQPHAAWECDPTTPAKTIAGFWVTWTSGTYFGSAPLAVVIDSPDLFFVSRIIDDSSGNGDGIADPGETIIIPITIHNDGWVGAKNITGVLSTTAPGVTIIDSAISWPDMTPLSDAESIPDHVSIYIHPDAPTGSIPYFTVALTAADYTTRFRFPVPISVPPILVIDDNSVGNAEVFAEMFSSMGMTVTLETASSTSPSTWVDYGFIVSSSGASYSPLDLTSYRQALEDYAQAGGKVIVEGGEVGYDSLVSPEYPTFAANVLHEIEWLSNTPGSIFVYSYDHPLTCYPNELPIIVAHSGSSSTKDAMTPENFNTQAMGWSTAPGASVVGWDPDENPYNGGQIVVLNFAIEEFGYGGIYRDYLIQNCATWLLLQDSLPYLVYEDHEIDDSAGGNGDGFVNPGETVLMPITVQNVGASELSGITLTIESISPYVTFITDTVTVPDLAAGEYGVTDLPSLQWQAALDTPDSTVVEFTVRWQTNETEGLMRLWEQIGSPDLGVTRIEVNDQTGDGDLIADPGETVVLMITMHNEGSTGASTINGTIATSTDGITITDSYAEWPDLDAGEHAQSIQDHFTITVDSTVEPGTLAEFTLSINALGYTRVATFSVTIGTHSILIVDDESYGVAGIIESILTILGYHVVKEGSWETDCETWPNYQLLISSSGDNNYPLYSASYRNALETYALYGGRLLIEGGNIAYVALYYNDYHSFAANVLHEVEWVSNYLDDLQLNSYAHPLTMSPHYLPPILYHAGSSGSTKDSVIPQVGAVPVMSWTDEPNSAGLVTWDPDYDAYNGGQIAVFNFDLTGVGNGGIYRGLLLHNTVEWLLQRDARPYLVYSGRSIDDTQEGNGNGVPDPGETVFMAITAQNLGTVAASEITATLYSPSPYVTILDRAATLADIPGGTSGSTLAPHFQWHLSEDIPDGEVITFTMVWISAESRGSFKFSMTVVTPDLICTGFHVQDPEGDNDGFADPGETAVIVPVLMNRGSLAASGISATLHCAVPGIGITDEFALWPDLQPQESAMSLPNHYTIAIADDVPIGTVAEFTLAIAADFGYLATTTFTINVGVQSVLIVNDYNASHAAIFADALELLGYEVSVELAAETNPRTWGEYGVVIWSSGEFTSPVNQAWQRVCLEIYAALGGKILLEGGDLGYDAIVYPGYDSFADLLLRENDWLSHSPGNLEIEDATHPVVTTPHLLPTIIPHSGFMSSAKDSMVAKPEASIILGWTHSAGCSLVGYDPDGDPDNGGQILVFNFSIEQVGSGGALREQLIENAVLWLMASSTTTWLTPTPGPWSPTPVSSATPTPELTPSPTTTPPTATPRPQVVVELALNQSVYYPGNQFQLVCHIENPGDTMDVEEYVILDVFGSYWFWENWTPALDFRLVTLPAQGDFNTMILNFSWPEGAGTLNGINLWAACLEPGTMTALSNIEMITFGYQE